MGNPRARGRRRIPRPLSRRDAHALMAAAKASGPRDQAVVMLLLECGLRVGEARHVLWDDLDRAAMTVRVTHGKGGRERIVPMATAEFLALTHCRDRHWPPDFREPPWLIAHRLQDPADDNPLTTRQLQRMVARLAAIAEIRVACTPHTLRHTYASALQDDQVQLRYIQELLGHASIQTTEIYTHVSPRQLMDVIRRRRRNPAQLELIA